MASTEGDDGAVGLDGVKADASAPRRGYERLKEKASAWRERMYANPVTKLIYRTTVLVVGAAITIVGLALVPLPGPGWVIVFVGLTILATESVWAQRLLDFAKDGLEAWTRWLRHQSLFVKGLVGLATAVLVACVFWGIGAYYGVPGFIPDSWIPPLPGLD